METPDILVLVLCHCIRTPSDQRHFLDRIVR